MNLSDNFTLAECIRSQTAARRGIDNSPPADVISRMIDVCRHVLEPIRAHYGRPFRPNSFYRCARLNTAIGGARLSQHVVGEAVDIEIPGVPNLELAAWIRDNIHFDQLILEFADNAENDPAAGWVHVSYVDAGNRGRVMRIDRRGTRLGLA